MRRTFGLGGTDWKLRTDCLIIVSSLPTSCYVCQNRSSPTHRITFVVTCWSASVDDPTPIGSPIIVTIWNVVFANKSRKLGWIWMKLGRCGWGLKELSLARFQRNRAMGFGESSKKWVAEALFFCDVNHVPLLPLSLDRFPTNFPRTRVQVVARDI